MPSCTILSLTILSVRGKVETRSHSVVWAVLELTLEPFSLLSVAMLKIMTKSNLERRSIPSTLHFTVHGETLLTGLLPASAQPGSLYNPGPCAQGWHCLQWARSCSTNQQSRKCYTDICTGSLLPVVSSWQLRLVIRVTQARLKLTKSPPASASPSQFWDLQTWTTTLCLLPLL